MHWTSILTRKIKNKETTITSKIIIKVEAEGYDEAMKKLKANQLITQGWQILTLVKNLP